MSGGGGDVKQTNEPPAWQRPYLEDLFRRAQLQTAQPQQYYPGQLVAPQSQGTQDATAALLGFGGGGFNQGVTGATATGLGTLSAAQSPGSNPVSSVGYALAPGSAATIQSAQQRAQQPVNLWESVGTAGQTFATPQTTQLGAGGSERFGMALDPTGTVARLQEQTRNPIQVPNTAPTVAETLGQNVNPADAINKQLGTAPGTNPYLDEMVNRTIAANTRNFNQNVLPASANASEISGGYGGSRQGVYEGIATQGLNDANARIAADLYSNQYNQDLQRQLQAAGLGTNIAATAGSQELGRTAQDRGFGLALSGIEGEDLSRQLAAGQTAGQLALSGDEAARARIAANNAAALNTGQYDLSRGALGLNVGSAEQNYMNQSVQQALQASGLGLNTLQSGYGMGLDAAGRAVALGPTAQQVGLGGANASLAAGQIQDPYVQNIIDQEVQRYMFNQQAPYSALESYRSAVTGVPGYGTTSAPAGSSGGVAGALGGAATGAAIVGGLGAAGLAITGPVGGAIIGLSALAGLFS